MYKIEYIIQKHHHRLGAIAVKLGFIDRKQLVIAVMAQKERIKNGESHKLLGTLLIELGFLTETQLRDVLFTLNETMNQDSDLRAEIMSFV